MRCCNVIKAYSIIILLSTLFFNPKCLAETKTGFGSVDGKKREFLLKTNGMSNIRFGITFHSTNDPTLPPTKKCQITLFDADGSEVALSNHAITDNQAFFFLSKGPRNDGEVKIVIEDKAGDNSGYYILFSSHDITAR